MLLLKQWMAKPLHNASFVFPCSKCSIDLQTKLSGLFKCRQNHEEQAEVNWNSQQNTFCHTLLIQCENNVCLLKKITNSTARVTQFYEDLLETMQSVFETIIHRLADWGQFKLLWSLLTPQCWISAILLDWTLHCSTIEPHTHAHTHHTQI